MFATISAEVQDHSLHHDAAMVSDHQGGRFVPQRPVQLERYQTMETNFFQKTVRQQRIRPLQHARERRPVESALAAGGRVCLHHMNRLITASLQDVVFTGNRGSLIAMMRGDRWVQLSKLLPFAKADKE